MSSKKKITTTFEVQALVSEAQKELNNFKNAAEDMWKHTKPPKSVSKEMADLELKLASLNELAKKIDLTPGDIAQAASDYKAIKKDIHNLSLSFKLLTDEQKKAMLGKDVAETLEKRQKALKQHAEIVKRNAANQAEWNELQSKKNTENNRVAATKIEIGQTQDLLNLLQSRVKEADEYKQKLELIEDLTKKIAKAESELEGIDPNSAPKTHQKKSEQLKNLKTQKSTASESLAKDTRGKSAYETVDLITARIDNTKTEINELNIQLEGQQKTIKEYSDRMDKLIPVSTQESLRDLKDTLRLLGVVIDEEKDDFDSLSGKVNKLEKKALNPLQKSSKKAEKSLHNLSEKTEQVGEKTEEATEDLKRQEEVLRNQEAFNAKIKQFLGLAGATEVLKRSLRNAFNTTKELDAAMTEMAVVTDLEVGDYWNQLPEHTKRASELGVAIGDVYKAETLYYQQGLKTAEAQSLANETLKMARIAGMEASEATDKMTAALRGFNMELNETSAQKVSDVYSELAAITAADVNEISSAMTKTASIASSAGMEFETTAAFLSQIIETTRESAETAGTAMKTVIARFQELKKSPNEIGEIDGEIVDANAIETALRSVGVSLRDSSGQFRELDDVFMELSSKWDSLDKNTQRYIATIAAGSRQQSRFIAMMSDYSRTQELVTAANNSAGASQKQYEKTLDSLETKLAKLKNAWDEFSMGILESDLVKLGVDILTKFLEIINKATSAFDGMGGSIMKVLTIVSMFKIGQKIFEKVRGPIMKFGETLKVDFLGIGKETGRAFVEGNRQGIEEAQKEQKKTTTEPKEEAKEKDSLKQKFYNSTGISNYRKGTALQEEIDKKTGVYEKKQNLKNAKNQLKNVKNDPNASVKDIYKAEEGYERAQKSLKKAEAEKKKYIASDEELKKQSQEAWTEIGKGISQAGQAIAGVGVGVSMLGGLFSSLGLEEVGDAFSTLGTIITFAGTAISGIGALIPVVAKVAVAAGISVQAAWWWLVAIVAVLAVAVVLVSNAIKKANAAKLENRMKAAEEATQRAKEAAEGAKQAYDEMVADREGFDKMQKKLAGLTKGTKEWKDALRESNAQILDLIQTYPELAKYVTRGEQGQLIISDEGWDEMINKQKQSVANANAAVSYNEMEQLRLEKEKAETSWKDDSKVIYSNSRKENEYATKNYRKQLEEFYSEGASLEDVKKYYEQFEDPKLKFDPQGAYEALRKFKEKEAEINTKQYSLGRASLSAGMSDEFLDSKFGDSVIDAFALTIDANNEKINEKAKAAGKKGKDSLYKNEDFNELAKKYEVTVEKGRGKTTEENVKRMYKAIIGTDADSTASVEEMLKSIYAADDRNKTNEKMTQYNDKLSGIEDKELAKNIAGMLTQSGEGMSGTFADKLLTDGKVDKAAVDKIAEENFGSIEKWAEMVGKTTEQLYEEIENNAVDAQLVNKNTFGRLNQVLGKTDNEIEKFGEDVQISTKNSANLVDKLVGLSQTVGDETAFEVKGLIDGVLNSAGDSAETLAGVIGTMNWSSVEDWEQLPEIVENMGISFEDGGAAFETFISRIKQLEITVKTVDLKKVTSEIQNMFSTLKSLQSGEQGRVFSKDVYDKLVASDPSRKDQFVQIGEEFHYIGSSMNDLTNALVDSTKETLALAQVQREQNLKVADSMERLDENGVAYGGKVLKATEGGSVDWARDEQIAYLEALRANGDMETLQYLTGDDGESLGLTLGTNFQELSDQQLDAVMKALEKNFQDAPEIRKALAKTIEDAEVAGRMTASYEENLAEANSGGEGANAAAKAFGVQAAQSGQVADAVIGRYNELIAGAEEKEEGELKKLQEVMKEGLDRANANLEAQKKIDELTNRVADALYNIGQAEIDKLSQLNDTVNEANNNLINKIQEQINDARQAREMEKAEQSIADKESRLAYLMRDSSGANTLEIQQLQKEIADEKENYGDQLVDKSLQDLQDVNAAAAEQRERQIEIMQAQLDYSKESGALMLEAEQAVEESLTAINNGQGPLGTTVADILTKDGETNESIGKMLTETANSADALGGDGSTDDNSIQSGVEALKKKFADEQKAADTAKEDFNERNEIVKTTAKELSSGKYLKGSSDYEKQIEAYKAAGGTAAQFESDVRSQLGGATLGAQDAVYTSQGANDNAGKEWDQGIKVTVGDETFKDLSYYQINKKSAETEEEAIGKLKQQGGISKEDMEKYIGVSGSKGDVVLYMGMAYILSKQWGKQLEMWMPLWNDDGSGGYATKLADAMRKAGPAFATGGLADFTGPAWLDGTKSHPELVLNQRDTENFIQLKDILAEVMKNSSTINSSTNSSSGDNYFDIDISVDSLKDDYDVEQLANKIRSMIYDDSMYRNVNTVNLIR